MINDRSCYRKELKIVIFTQQLLVHNKIQAFLPEQEYSRGSILSGRKFIHNVFLA